MKRILPIMLVICLLLCACATEADPAESTVTTTEVQVETTAATEQTTAPVEETTEETTAPIETTEAQIYYNPLNGEVIDQAYNGRVFATTINNVEAALPLRGINQADFFFEMYVNSYATRGLAFFSDVTDLKAVGSIRSFRQNFADLCWAFDAIVLHAGNGSYGKGLDQINANEGVGFRDYNRYNKQGYNWEHTLFASGEDLINAATERNYELQRPGRDYGLHFVEDGTPVNGESASEVEIILTLDSSTKRNIMKYDESLGKYIFWQYGEEQIDENTGEPIRFENVIVMFANVENVKSYHIADLNTSGEGYYACGGKIVPIKWIHENQTDPFTFTLEDGTPLQQGVGSTYVAIAPIGSPVNYQ